MKKLLLAAFLSLLPVLAHATFPIFGTVKISTDTTYSPTQQAGAINVSSGTIATLNASTATITTITSSSGTVTALTSSTATITTITSSSATITTLNNQLARYRRPVLQYNSATVVNLETGTLGTSGQASILFPDGQLINDSTAGHINCNLAQVASTGASPQSGLFSGTVANNTWYSFFAVKANSGTALVVIAIPLEFKQANFVTFNSDFGTNSWTYLATLPYGDNSGTANAIPKFVMAGNTIKFYNLVSLSNVSATPTSGIRLATTASATTLAWAYASGVTVGTQIPANITAGYMTISIGAGTSVFLQDSGGNVNFWAATTPSSSSLIHAGLFYLGIGFKQTASGTATQDIVLSGYVDTALGIGNPLL